MFSTLGGTGGSHFLGNGHTKVKRRRAQGGDVYKRQVVAFVLIIGFIYLLFRPYKESNTLNVNVKSVAKAK